MLTNTNLSFNTSNVHLGIIYLWCTVWEKQDSLCIWCISSWTPCAWFCNRNIFNFPEVLSQRGKLFVIAIFYTTCCISFLDTPEPSFQNRGKKEKRKKKNILSIIVSPRTSFCIYHLFLQHAICVRRGGMDRWILAVIQYMIKFNLIEEEFITFIKTRKIFRIYIYV
jgi:hypothetical protein